ncbi:MAG: hypothetical protein M0C28_17635 [Candidatus Moduliflexus flocculans]|nr:hypothetical protein [Candidatus Moduliflexus flocculans]
MSLIADPARDHVSRTVYDAANRATFSLDALNQVIERAYDAHGNVIKTTAYATAIARPATVTDASVRAAVGLVADAAHDRTSRTVYDAAHRAVYGIDALGYVTETGYDPTGQVRETIAHYDAIDLAALGASPEPVDITAALAARSLVQAEKDQHTVYEYDAAGRLTTTTDAEGYSEHYQYDALGNKIAFTNKKGVDAGDPQYTWHYAYDPAGRLIEETTPAVEVTRLTESPDGTIIPVTTAEPVITRIAYDALGNVIARTEAYGTVDERTTEYRYDALGRQVETIYPEVAVYSPALDSLTDTGVVITRSANVMNNAWVRNATTNVLEPTVGVSHRHQPVQGCKRPAALLR